MLRSRFSNGDATSFLYYNTLTNNCIAGQINILKLPIFSPNDYFWQHHWDGKEPKWECFANAVRTIMAEAGELGLSEGCMEDKLVYKGLVYGKKTLTDSNT